MIKVVADTNFLLDLMVPSRPLADAAARVFDAMNADRVEVAVCAGSLKDAYYIARRECTEEGNRAWMGLFLDSFDVFPVDSLLCRAALESTEPDFEDGLIRVCAEWWDADYIVSRDRKAFMDSRIPRIEAPDLLRVLY